jgi:hypothetical protein
MDRDFMRRLSFCCWGMLIVGVWTQATSAQGESALVEQVRQTLQAACRFFHDQVAIEGGYVYRYSEDLSQREGEEKTGPTTVWIQPPGTPAVGMAYLEAYRRTREPSLLAAAKDTAMCLVRGQLHSGGWSNSIDFDPVLRRQQAYRVDGPLAAKAKNVSTLDDNKSQSAIRFLASLDQMLDFQEPIIHEATLYAAQALLDFQYPNGAWPQRFSTHYDREQYPVLAASYPETWSRQFPAVDYSSFYTLNDSTLVDAMHLMLYLHQIYGDARYYASALKAGEFLLLAQMPEPQPAWAQQYDAQMHPAWARKFEPPAITGGESQKIIDSLMDLYQASGDRRFLEAAERALGYLSRSLLPTGNLARFYELASNRPLYFTRDYRLTYEDDDLPTHYGFIVSSNLSKLQTRWQKLSQANARQLAEGKSGAWKVKEIERPEEELVTRVVAAMDSRGAWVETGNLSTYRGDNPPNQVIDSKTFIKNLDILSRYLATP